MSYVPSWWSARRWGAGHKALQDVPDQINAMLNRFIQHADGIAAEMVRTGGVFQYNFPKL